MITKMARAIVILKFVVPQPLLVTCRRLLLNGKLPITSCGVYQRGVSTTFPVRQVNTIEYIYTITQGFTASKSAGVAFLLKKYLDGFKH